MCGVFLLTNHLSLICITLSFVITSIIHVCYIKQATALGISTCTGYALVERNGRTLAQSPGKRVFTLNSDRFKESIAKNKVKGIPKDKQIQKWEYIGLPDKINQLNSIVSY